MKPIPLLIAGAVVVIGLFSSMFVVNQTESAVEIRLGDPTRVISEPGLYFKLPLVTEIRYFDKRLLLYDSQTGTIITRDKKTMLVDNFARWRVVDPLLFYQSVRTQNAAMSRLDDIIYSQLREMLGKFDLEQIISERSEMLALVTSSTQNEVKSMGMEVFDVRIKRADLPDENSRAVYGRMEAERRRIAKRYLSEGEEEALKLRSQADREKAELISRAERDSARIKGKADAEAASIYAAAYNKDREFYRYWRTLNAYRKTLKEGTTVILSDKDSEFLRYFK